MSPKVQRFATGLVKDVYGKIMPPQQPEGEPGGAAAEQPLTLEELAERVSALPKRDELIASFAVLQAELEREQQRTRNWVKAMLGVQLLTIVGVAAILILR